jgi:hypothetical protein
MAIKAQRIIYQSKNNETGQAANIKALQIRRNGTVVASNVALTEISSVNEPGAYELVLSTTALGTYGGVGFYDVYIDSTVSAKRAPAVAVRVVTANDDDDNAAAVNAVNTIVSDIQTKVSSGTYGLAALKGLIDALQATVNTDAAALADIEGTGFISANDSLKSISDRIFTGGTAI